VEEADRRSFVDTVDLKKHMSTSWARASIKITVGDEFQITVDQLRPDRVEMKILTATLTQLCIGNGTRLGFDQTGIGIAL